MRTLPLIGTIVVLTITYSAASLKDVRSETESSAIQIEDNVGDSSVKDSHPTGKSVKGEAEDDMNEEEINEAEDSFDKNELKVDDDGDVTEDSLDPVPTADSDARPFWPQRRRRRTTRRRRVIRQLRRRRFLRRRWNVIRWGRRRWNVIRWGRRRWNVIRWGRRQWNVIRRRQRRRFFQGDDNLA